jgi:hypothetical protein
VRPENNLSRIVKNEILTVLAGRAKIQIVNPPKVRNCFETPAAHVDFLTENLSEFLERVLAVAP